MRESLLIHGLWIESCSLGRCSNCPFAVHHQMFIGASKPLWLDKLTQWKLDIAPGRALCVGMADQICSHRWKISICVCTPSLSPYSLEDEVVSEFQSLDIEGIWLSSCVHTHNITHITISMCTSINKTLSVIFAYFNWLFVLSSMTLNWLRTRLLSN